MPIDDKLKPVQAATLGFGLAVLCGVLWKAITSDACNSTSEGMPASRSGSSTAADRGGSDRATQRYVSEIFYEIRAVLYELLLPILYLYCY